MRFPRLTTRRLMALVAALSVALAAARLVLLSGEYRRRALHHANWHELLAREPHARTWLFAEHARPRTAEELRKMERELGTYHGALSRKYSRAASRPWMPVAPDPPAPPVAAAGYIQD